MLLAADLAGLLCAFAATELLFLGQGGPVDGLSASLESIVFIATLPAWVVGAKLYGLYDRDSQNADHTTVDEFPSIFHFVTVAVWLFFAGSWITGLTDPNQPKLATFWLLAICAITGFRVTARAVARRRTSYIQNAIIVGAGDVGQLLGRKLRNHSEYGINLVGFVDSAPKERREDLGDLTLLGPLESVPGLVRELDVERVIIAFSNESHSDILDVIRSLKDLDVQIDIVPRLFEIVGPRLNINSVEGLPIVSIPPLRLPRSSRLIKRGLDLTLAAIGLILLRPCHGVGSPHDQARFEGSGPVRAGPDGCKRSNLPDVQVPDDVQRRRPSEADAEPSQQTCEWRLAHVQDPGGSASDEGRPGPPPVLAR